MAALTVVTRPSKKDSEGRAPLYLRISHQSVTRYISLGYKLKPRRWNKEKEKVRKGHPDQTKLNRYLSEVKTKARRVLTDLVTSGEEVTARRLKRRIAQVLREGSAPSGKAGDFLAYWKEALQDYRRRGQMNSFYSYRSIFRNFREYIREAEGRETLPYRRIDVPLIRGFKTYLIETKGHAQSTVARSVGSVKTFVRKAIQDGYMDQGQNPFFKIDVERPRTRKEKLSLDEIEAIEALDLPEGTPAWHVRNWFLFSFYAGGLRFKDVALLRHKHLRWEGEEVRLAYAMNKTGRRAGSLLHERAVEIASRYGDLVGDPDKLVFNIVDGEDLSTPDARYRAVGNANRRANRILKDIQADAGIDTTLTFHLARHSIADYLRRKGWSVYDIQQLLRHQHISTTEQYLADFDTEGLDDQIRDLF